MVGNIHSIETFGTVDGPGIRYVIFVQGCPMRCAYCHNPDTWTIGVGEDMEVDKLIADISRYTRYIEGVTVSGGEPLLQMDFLIDLFAKVKAIGLSTCIDTSGILYDDTNVEFMANLDKLLDVCDLVMLDVKHIDDSKHHELTGRSNKTILEFAKYLEQKRQRTWLRYVLVPSINDDETTLHEWKKFFEHMRNIEKIEVLPYHKLGLEKYEKLGIKYRLSEVKEPTQDQINLAKQILEITEEK